MNYCTECRYSKRTGFMRSMECHHDKALVEINPVYGNEIYLECDAMRFLHCEDGILFEPGLNIISRVIGWFTWN